jgi:hypothetical protein
MDKEVFRMSFQKVFGIFWGLSVLSGLGALFEEKLGFRSGRFLKIRLI